MPTATCLALLAAVSCAPRSESVTSGALAPSEPATVVLPPPPSLEPEPTSSPAEDDAAKWLDPDAKAPMTAYLARHRPPRWHPSGAALGAARHELEYPRSIAVVEVSGEWLRVRETSSDLVLLLWVQASDVAPQLQALTALAPSSDLRRERGYLEIAPAEPLRLIEERAPACHVETFQVLSEGGWVPCAALGPTVRQEYLPEQRGDATVPADTKILVRPGGPVLFVVDEADSPVDVQAAEGAWSLIQYVVPCASVRVTGFVPSKALTPGTDLEMAVGCLGLAGTSNLRSWGALATAPREDLDAGVDLFDESGRLVGRTLQPTKVALDAEGVRHVETDWGPLPVHLRARGRQ